MEGINSIGRVVMFYRKHMDYHIKIEEVLNIKIYRKRGKD